MTARQATKRVGKHPPRILKTSRRPARAVRVYIRAVKHGAIAISQ